LRHPDKQLARSLGGGPVQGGGNMERNSVVWPSRMTDPLEVTANAVNLVSIGLAGRRNVHTWWTGIVGCVLFAWVFFGAKLYADVCLQGFFVVTGVLGWWHWAHPRSRHEVPITHAPLSRLLRQCVIGVLVTAAYAWALERFTDASAPLPDAAVLTTSVLGQLLLVEKRVESWYFWLATNSIAVPLFLSRGLYVTGVLYCVFWVNALVSLRQWYILAQVDAEAAA
jgi:nicotinamide mononucleotide transporter